ncbi:hypothetical protein J4437_02175 [Candidatus Woesearchaeota archaeon]|nr:hypothetical protein [Candidatus Woesearchaeota archaeon]
MKKMILFLLTILMVGAMVLSGCKSSEDALAGEAVARSPPSSRIPADFTGKLYSLCGEFGDHEMLEYYLDGKLQRIANPFGQIKLCKLRFLEQSTTISITKTTQKLK